jgi:hypothetical protein
MSYNPVVLFFKKIVDNQPEQTLSAGKNILKNTNYLVFIIVATSLIFVKAVVPRSHEGIYFNICLPWKSLYLNVGNAQLNTITGYHVVGSYGTCYSLCPLRFTFAAGA